MLRSASPNVAGAAQQIRTLRDTVSRETGAIANGRSPRRRRQPSAAFHVKQCGESDRCGSACIIPRCAPWWPPATRASPRGGVCLLLRDPPRALVASLPTRRQGFQSHSLTKELRASVATSPDGRRHTLGQLHMFTLLTRRARWSTVTPLRVPMRPSRASRSRRGSARRVPYPFLSPNYHLSALPALLRSRYRPHLVRWRRDRSPTAQPEPGRRGWLTRRSFATSDPTPLAH